MVTPPPIPVAAIFTPVSVPPPLPEKVKIPDTAVTDDEAASPRMVIASAAVLADVIRAPSAVPDPITLQACPKLLVVEDARPNIPIFPVPLLTVIVSVHSPRSGFTAEAD